MRPSAISHQPSAISHQPSVSHRSFLGAGRLQHRGVRFSTQETVDFVIVGSGAAGGIIAKELSTAGLKVVVLEQGPWLKQEDFRHDEVDVIFRNGLSNDPAKTHVTFRKTEQEEAKEGAGQFIYHRLVGGGSVCFTANYWRLHEVDFIERSKLGTVAGSGLVDWPIRYQDLEPYYTRAEWELGVSGQAGASPFDPPRSRPYPLPPMPVKSSGVLFERAAKKLGLHPFPAPMAIISQPYRGRTPCQHCGYCLGFGCEYGAKSSTLFTTIPTAVATGKCEIRSESYARKIEVNDRGRVTGVVYFDRDKVEQFQPARAVVVCCNGSETPRLLLMSQSNLFPNGLANSSGVVGKYLMFNGYSANSGVFEGQLNEYKSIMTTRILHDFYESDPKRGFYGGGGIDARFMAYPVLWALGGLPKDGPQWGLEYKHMLRDYYTHVMNVDGHTTSLPVETNSISLDPTVKDAWGLPAMRVTYRDHPDDIATMKFFQARCREILEAAGAKKMWSEPVKEQNFAAHLLGTCRMGDDPKSSVIDRYHRAHDVRNLFIADGSSMVTGGRGQPTATIQALAFRAGESIAGFARRNEM
ncbi:MAG: GMC family oxidoreductase [Gemmatimonadetes bacterium]|nr:GMC family oxidoreductase [Gemmatimonadota bacterium]